VIHLKFAQRSLACVITQTVLVITFVLVSATARADIALQWQNTEMDERQQLLADFLTDSNVMTDLLALLQENFEFEPPLGFVIGAADGPLFDADTHSIRFPFAYISDALEVQMELLEEGETAVDRSLDVVEYTLYHLVAHALLDSASTDLDDQVEQIASWLMIRGFKNGAEQVVMNARAFGALSQKIDGPIEDYWHGHALYAKRQREIECWALGRDPETIEPLLPAVLEPLVRASDCRVAWEELDQRVRKWLADELKTDASILNG